MIDTTIKLAVSWTSYGKMPLKQIILQHTHQSLISSGVGWSNEPTAMCSTTYLGYQQAPSNRSSPRVSSGRTSSCVYVELHRLLYSSTIYCNRTTNNKQYRGPWPADPTLAACQITNAEFTSQPRVLYGQWLCCPPCGQEGKRVNGEIRSSTTHLQCMDE